MIPPAPRSDPDHGPTTGRSGHSPCALPEPREFSDDEVAFLTAVATLVMLAVERYRVEQVTRDAALHDPLTGLANRTLALDRLALALARRQRERIDIAVLVLDLDGFKTINDSLGHAAGDEVLLALAPRLTERSARRTRSRGSAETSSSSSAPTSPARTARPRSPSG